MPKPTRITDAPGKRKIVQPSKPTRATDLLDVSGGMPPLSSFQGYRQGRVARRDIKNAAYNPRTIDKAARKELERIIRSKKLVSSLTWNERTGNLVGGHQRLSILDALEGSENYSLDCDIVDVSIEEERELNLLLNNPDIQGTYDPLKLEELFNLGVDFKAAGFSELQIQAMFPDSDAVNSMFSIDKQPAEVQQAHGDLEELQGLQEAEKDRIRAEKKAHREKAKTEDDTEFRVLVVFANREEREHFMELLGEDPNGRYLDGRDLMAHLEAERMERAQ